MKLTRTQKKAMKELALCKVVRRKMWRTEKQLGYTNTSANRRYYDINIANDTGSREVEDIVLLHEIGHCYFGHNDLDIREELLLVKSMCDGAGLPFSATLLYGGPMRFLNIAMDLEINSKLLTVGNIKAMKKFGFELCTPEGFQIDTGESYRSYYMPLLEKARAFMDKMPSGSGEGEGEGGDGDGDEEKDKGKSGGGKNKDKGNSKGNSAGDKIPGIKNDTGDDLSSDSPLTGIEEIDDALLKEGYIGGDVKAKDKSNKSDTSTVKEKEKEIEEAEGGGGSGTVHGGKGIGNSGSTSSTITIEAENTPKEIEKFLRSIIGNAYDFLMDPMRLWNRGSRDRSSGVIYNSLKQAPQRKRKKLGILVDISGSMDISTIQNAAQSLKDCAPVLDKGSKFVTWNTDLGQEFPITNIPDQIRVGGGTDMVAGINYLVKQGFTDIVVYSDFETSNLETVDPKGYRLYSIVVRADNYGSDARIFNAYLNKNKKVLLLK